MSDPNITAEVIPPSEISHYTTVSDLLENEPSAVAAIESYYAGKRVEYLARVSKIEELLGFLASEAAMGARLERLERHVGLKAV